MPWIWLDKKIYPQFQRNRYNTLFDCDNKESEDFRYCVVDFFKEYKFDKKIKTFRFRVSADNCYILHINNELIGIGPALPGGDFLCNGKPPKFYADKYELDYSFEKTNKIEINAKVRLQPEMCCDYSSGYGGFYLSGSVIFDDGTTENIETDSSWFVEPDEFYKDFLYYNSAEREPCKYFYPSVIENPRNTEDSSIPPRSLNKIFETGIWVGAGETLKCEYELDKIYGFHPVLESYGNCDVILKTCELKGQSETEERIIFGHHGKKYFSFRMHSASVISLCIANTDDHEIRVDMSLIAPWYPIENEGWFDTNNESLNRLYDVCKHTLKICRQSIHLDSTKHQELLACTGDYNIESLMTMFCFGDMRLAEFDLMRTADWLVANNGIMFHTTYSLIWVQMLHDVYMITGRKEILLYCRNALDILLSRFESYKGENGIIDNPPDFMFVDWTVVDGFSMHHPPKALGQTVLNCFYYNALINASKIYEYIKDNKAANETLKTAEIFKKRFNETFFDNEKKLYFDGLGTPYGGDKHYHPANINKKYFTKYPNILASLYGLADEVLAKNIIERIIFDDTMQDIQPYFMHYLLDAVRKYGLFEKYGMKLLERWIPVVEECDKGLAEGWISPEEGYSFDHSHAWGGTPAYQMPMAITGLEILEPGMKKLKFTPELYGLEFAEIIIPTEYGNILFKAEKDKKTIISAPECIEIIRGD